MKKLLLLLIVSCLSISSFAEVYFGIGYGNISDSDDGDSISLGAIDFTVGNRVDENFAFELTLSQGIQDDEFDGIEAELDTSFAARALYHFNENLFINAFWGRVELEGCYNGLCVGASETEGGIGIGADFPLENNSAIRLSLDSVDDAEIVSLKYIF